MADVERSLIGRVLQAREMDEVVSHNIEPDHFSDEECQEVWEFMLSFLRKHKEPPTAQVVTDQFPDFKFNISKEPVSYHIERFVRKVKKQTAIQLVRSYHDAIDDPEQVDDIDLVALDMARTLTEIIPSPRAKRFSEVDQRIEEYHRRMKEGDTPGIMMGIPTFDKVTLGIQPHEFCVIVAYMGVGKTTMMQHIAYSAYLQKKTALFISLEVEAEAILRKLDVMATHVRYHSMKALELEAGDLEQWKRIADQAHKDRHERDIIVRDDIKNCTADHVLAEAIRYKPDIILVDYLELMRSPRSNGIQTWEQVSFSGVQMKQNARVMRIPHVSAAQLNREGGKGEVNLANVSFQSIGKHSDIMMGLAQDEERARSREMNAMLLKSRDSERAETTMRWNLDRMDIGEAGLEERFPERNGHSDKNKNRLLEAARTAGPGVNPFKGKGKKNNPFSARKKV